MSNENKPTDRDAFLSAAAELMTINILLGVLGDMMKVLNGEKQDPPRKRVIALGPAPEAVEIVEGELEWGKERH